MSAYAYWYQLLYIYMAFSSSFLTSYTYFSPKNHVAKFQNKIVWFFIRQNICQGQRLERVWENLNSYTLLVGLNLVCTLYRSFGNTDHLKNILLTSD